MAKHSSGDRQSRPIARRQTTRKTGANSEETQTTMTTSAHPRRSSSPLKASDIDINSLIYFAAVSSELSFTRAAARLGVDQSWLSQKIRQFESQLGCSLFERSTRRVSLTDAGRVLAGPAKQLSAVSVEAQRAAKLLTRSMEASMRIGALPHSFWQKERFHLIDTFITQHPEINVEVVNGSSVELIRSLREGHLDAAFSCWPFDPSGLEMLLLRTDRYGLLVPEEHRLARQDTLVLEDFAGEEFVTAPEKHNPLTYHSLYGPLLKAGAVPVQVPEFEHSALIRQAKTYRRVCLFNLDSEAHPIETGMVRRQLSGNELTNKKCLTRVKDRFTPPVLAFWELALQNGATLFSPDPEPAPLELTAI
ncbi:LysR family transcriptional regulator [Hyphomonas oceanitis]|uniref:LysR substrate-binding domain-containing protein n=1 Tax=Hyphomonas oceanitis TaxID=81033 RepID=UPI003002A73D